MHVQKSIDEIRAYWKGSGKSRWRLAEDAGLGRTTLRDIDKPDWSPSVATMRKIQALMEATG